MREKQNNIMKRVPGSRRPDARISKRYGEGKKRRGEKKKEMKESDFVMVVRVEHISMERSGRRVMYDGVHAT